MCFDVSMPTLEPVDTDFVTPAPRTIVVEQEIAADPAAVWAVLTDNDSWTTWYPNMNSCITTSDPGHGVGATRSVAVGSLKADERFVAWDEPKLWAFTIVKTNLPMAKRFLEQVELVGGESTTTARYTGAYEPTAFTRPIASLIDRQIRTAWTNGLAGLAAHLAHG